MAEQSFKGASVRATEIDLTAPGKISPQGVPAGVIGVASKGPAFVPVTFATKADFDVTFGPSDGQDAHKNYGALAVYEWLRNARSCTYLRVMGCGDGKKRSSSDGTVTSAGFVVGAKQVQADGVVGSNAYANQTAIYSSPVATATITFTGDATINQTITIISTDGTSRTYSAKSAGNAAAGTYDCNNGVATSASTLAAAINNNDSTGHASKITATNPTASTVLLTQVTAGAAGNTTITSNLSNATVPAAFTGGDDLWAPASLGRTYFLGAIMKENGGMEDYRPLHGAGISNYNSASLLRAVLLAPSGVSLTLSGWDAHSNVSASAYSHGKTGQYWDNGHAVGAIDLSANGRQSFVLMMNGYKNSNWPSTITASLDPADSNYLATKFNTDASLTEERGHCLYADFPVWDSEARVVDGDNAYGATAEHRLFLVTGSHTRNADTTGKPNFEGFQDRFTHSRSPWIISQALGGKNINLFKVHSVDDGDATRLKISIENICKTKTTADDYGSFDLVVRDLYDDDIDQTVLDEFRGLNLDPRSDNYIARRIGDINLYYDFDKNVGSQKLVREGMYPLKGKKLIRVEMNSNFADGEVDATALPVGFRGFGHLVTSGSSMLSPTEGSADYWSGDTFEDFSKGMRQPPVPFRRRITDGNLAVTRTPNSNYYWGVQFYRVKDPFDPNLTSLWNGYIDSMLKYFPDYGKNQAAFVVGNEGAADVNNSILDADLFNNNLFTLERVLIKTQSAVDEVNHGSAGWKDAYYVRTGVDPETAGMRFLNVSKDFGPFVASKKYYKFTLPLVGGFNGTNIFNDSLNALDNEAAFREMVDVTNQLGTSGPTVSAYRKAIDVMAEKSDVDIQILAIPGLREPGVTDYAITQTEERFDAIFIMDIEQCDEYGSADANVITGSSKAGPASPINVTNTIARLESRNLDSSFAAAYFPNVSIQDPNANTLVHAPPSVSMLGGFALNDTLAYPWYAPAGFTRGALKGIEPFVKMNEENRGALYEADVNPIVTYPGRNGVVCMGQKTLLKAQSALDRVNVRRLLIDIRRKVKEVANTVLFEPNRAETLIAFSARVEPILARIQAQQGLDRFRVMIDTTTTTQQDVENNTIRGKIFLQPTRAVEFISLDFVITNAGAEI